MADIFLTGTQNLGTDQPEISVPTIPPWDGTAAGTGAVLEAMTAAIQVLSNQLPQANNLDTGAGGKFGFKLKQDKKNNQTRKKGGQKPRWVEVARTTKDKKIYSSQDPTVFVKVREIITLTMQDTVTGEQWEWHL